MASRWNAESFTHLVAFRSRRGSVHPRAANIAKPIHSDRGPARVHDGCATRFRTAWLPTTKAIHFIGRTNSPTGGFSSFQEVMKVRTVNEIRSAVINSGQPGPDPPTDSVDVTAEQLGSLCDGVGHRQPDDPDVGFPAPSRSARHPSDPFKRSLVGGGCCWTRPDATRSSCPDPPENKMHDRRP